MNVLFVGRYNDSEVLNGPEKVAKRIFCEYSKENTAVFAEYFFDGRKYSFLKKLFGFEKVIETENLNVLRFGIVQFLLFLFKKKPEVIQIITYERFAVICFLYKFFFNVKIIYNVHGIISFENTILNKTNSLYAFKDRICEYIFFEYSDKLIFLSKRSVELSRKYNKIQPDKIEIIPNGVDEVFYLNGINKEINYTAPLNIVFAGDEERKEKGLDFLMTSVLSVKFKLNIFIIGNYSQEIISSNSNIEIKMIHRMETGNFSLFLSDKDVFVSASSYEQFSITAAECMASGLAPVVTAETGMSDYLNKGINGFIVSYNDVAELCECLSVLNSDRNLLKNISESSRNIYTELSWGKIFGKYKSFYN